MTIKAKLKEEFIGEGGYYPTNKHEEINSKLEEVIEEIDSPKTPVLADNYKVIYEGNEPEGCKIEGVPEAKNHYTSSHILYYHSHQLLLVYIMLNSL